MGSLFARQGLPANEDLGLEEVAEPGATLTILSYNVWFEDVAFTDRMTGLCEYIRCIKPDVLMLQEVTPKMLAYWSRTQPWLMQDYSFSPAPRQGYFTMIAFRKQTMAPINVDPPPSAPGSGSSSPHTPPPGPRPDPFFKRWFFPTSNLERDVVAVPVRPLLHPQAPALVVGTSHLESPVGALAFPEREKQVREGVEHLAHLAQEVAAVTPGQPPQEVDILWGGDMNWVPEHQSGPPLPPGAWQDLWPLVRPDDPGETYNPLKNDMIRNERWPACRLDRFFSRLRQQGPGWRVRSLRMIGTLPLPGKQAHSPYGPGDTAVLVSDHFGLLLRLRA